VDQICKPTLRSQLERTNRHKHRKYFRLHSNLAYGFKSLPRRLIELYTMLSLFTRRVALSAYRSTATYARILPSPISTLRARTIADTSLHANTIRTNPQHNASTKAAATTKKTGPSTKSITMGRTKPRTKLTPEEKVARAQVLQMRKELEREKKAAAAASLRAKRKARAEKEKEAAAQKRKRLAEKKKKLASAKKEKERKEKEKEKEKKTKAEAKVKERKKAMEAKKPNRACIRSHTHVRCRAQEYLSWMPVIKPPPRRINGFTLYLQEAKKRVQVGITDWKNLTEEERQVGDVSAFVLGTADSY